MQKTIYQRIATKDLLYSIPGYVYFLYLLFPFRFWEPFVFPNQTETVVISVFFACILLLFTFLKAYKATTFQSGKIDLFLVIYGIYLLCRFRYPLEEEYLFQAFSLVCIYLYFKNFPKNYLEGLFFLVPIAGVIQMIDGVNRFTMPWQNFSHITGIFFNTGLFGGFAALGFIVCTGLFFFSDSGKWYLKSIVSFLLSAILAIQAYVSGSRASWVAALITIFFLLYRFVPKFHIPSLRGGKPALSVVEGKQSGITQFILASCLLVLLVFFSNYLYHLKKDSADGRLLIGRVSMEMVKDAPVFGHGITGFRSGYLNYQANYFQAHPDSPYRMNADDVQTPYNEFLKILIEQGIIGLFLFSALIYWSCCLKRTQMTRITQISADNTNNAMQSIILFILIFGLFSYPFDKLPFVVLFVFSLAVLSQNQNPVFAIQLRKRNYLRIPLLLALCLVSLIIAENTYRYAKSCRMWNHALAHYGLDKEKSLSQLKKLYPELENNSVFLTTYGKVLNFGGHGSEAIAVLEKAVKRRPLAFSYIELGKSYEAGGFPEKALNCWNRAGLMVPSRFTPLYLTMKLHFKNGEYGQAQEYARQLLAKKIKIDNPEIDEMKRDARYILNFHPPPNP